MSKKTKKLFSNPWTIAIGSGLILWLIPVVCDYVGKKRIMTTFIATVKEIWKFIISVLTFDLKVWWVLVGIAVVIGCLYLYSRYLDAKESISSELPFAKYTEDYILKYKWEWVWKKQYDGTYDAEYIHPICDKCNTPLVDCGSIYGGAKCIRCGKKFYENFPKIDHVKMLIRDNAKRLCEETQKD